jgi:hypothetical protein
MKTINVKGKITIAKKRLVEVLKPVVYISGFCRYSQEDIIDSLIAAAIRKESLEYVSHSPNSDTVFLRIKGVLTPSIMKSVARSLRPKIDDEVDFAVDGHDEMYYGQNVAGIVGTKEKLGSHTAFKYLVVKIISKGIEYIVDVVEMFDGSVTESTITALKELGHTYKIRRVVADGEFYSIDLVRYLQSIDIEWVMRSRTFAALEDLNLRCNVPYKNSDIRLTLGKEFDENVKDHFIYRLRGRKNKKSERTDYYVASNIETSGQTIRNILKRRWRIETGFRDINRVKIKTCTRNYLLRMLFYTIACFIYNVWILVRRIKKKAKIRLNRVKNAFIDVIKLCASPILRLVGIQVSG